MFERFTEPARNVVVHAQHEVRQLRHPYIGTEHLLLGLLDDADGGAGVLLHDAGLTRERAVAAINRLLGPIATEAFGEDDAAALQEIGIDLDAVRAKVEEVFGPGALQAPEPDPSERRRGLLRRKPSSMAGHIPFSARAKKVLELSLREALALHHNFIGTEHILLGILRENGGLAAKVLAEAGVDFEGLRRQAIASVSKAA
jgi:ATP-dependent Clp protease ATP-binding subunit ClpA